MRILFTTTVWLLTVSGSLLLGTEIDGATLMTVCNNATVIQTAYVGDSVSIACNYSQADESTVKHFCRHVGNFTCTNIISAQRSDYTKLAKVSLSDDKHRGVYTVNMSALTQEDSGKYRCVLESINSITCLQDIHLRVLNPGTVTTHSNIGQLLPQPEQLTSPPHVQNKMDDELKIEKDDGSASGEGNPTKDEEPTTKPAHTTDGAHEVTPGAIGGIVCGVLAVIVIVTVVLILCRRKLFNRQASGGASEQKTDTVQSTERNHADHQYEEIQMQNKQANTASTLYSTVNPPADQQQYATITIQSSGSIGNDKKASSASNNRLEGAAPAEPTLYSTIAKPGG